MFIFKTGPRKVFRF